MRCPESSSVSTRYGVVTRTLMRLSLRESSSLRSSENLTATRQVHFSRLDNKPFSAITAPCGGSRPIRKRTRRAKREPSHASIKPLVAYEYLSYGYNPSRDLTRLSQFNTRTRRKDARHCSASTKTSQKPYRKICLPTWARSSHPYPLGLTHLE